MSGNLVSRHRQGRESNNFRQMGNPGGGCLIQEMSHAPAPALLVPYFHVPRGDCPLGYNSAWAGGGAMLEEDIEAA